VEEPKKEALAAMRKKIKVEVLLALWKAVVEAQVAIREVVNRRVLLDVVTLKTSRASNLYFEIFSE